MTTLVKGELKKDGSSWSRGETFIDLIQQEFVFTLTNPAGKDAIPNNRWALGQVNSQSNGNNGDDNSFETLKANEKLKSNGTLTLDKTTYTPQTWPGNNTVLDKLKTAKQIWVEGTLQNGRKGLGTISVSNHILLKTPEFGGKGGGAAPGTPQQEAVTLDIFRILLDKNGYDPKGKDDIVLEADFRKFCDTDLSKIWSGLKISPDTKRKTKVPRGKNKYEFWKTDAEINTKEGVRKWFWSFYLQFKHVRELSNLPNNQFNVFNYDEFMAFISNDIVLAGPPRKSPISGRSQPWNRGGAGSWGTLTKKDSWNPADIWLVNKNQRYYDDTIEAIQQAKTIRQLNRILINAYIGVPPLNEVQGERSQAINPKNPIIAGVSLKKTRATATGWPGRRKKIPTNSKDYIEYDLVNLSYKGDILPQVQYDNIIIELDWEKRAGSPGQFRKVTNEMIVLEEESPHHPGGQIGQMKMGSGGFEIPHNINLEFQQKGGGAMLGKIPKDLLGDRIAAFSNTLKLPTHEVASESIPNKETDSDSQWNQKINRWEQKIRLVKSKIGTGPGKLFTKGSGVDVFVNTYSSKNQLGTFDFIYYIVQARNSNAWKNDMTKYRMNIVNGCQLMDWYYLLSRIYDLSKASKEYPTKKAVFDDFIEDTYYLAQKRGSKIKRFGPFGKLH